MEIERIADQLERSFNGPAWHGASLKEALQGVTLDVALRRPIAQAHTIFELVQHIHTWQRHAANILKGSQTRPTDAEDWPESRTPDEAAWSRALQQLDAAHADILDALSKFGEERLGEIPQNREYTVYQILHGVIQHNLFHAGQICILKK